MHPTEGPARHELYLMCDDIDTTVAELTSRGVVVEGGISDQGWGAPVHHPAARRRSTGRLRAASSRGCRVLTQVDRGRVGSTPVSSGALPTVAVGAHQ